MIRQVRWVVVAAAGLVLAFGVLGGRAADDKKDEAEAKKLAAEVAKKFKDFEDVMHLFALRTKKGWGVGDKPGAIVPDGIEKMVETLADKGKLPPAQVDAQAGALTEMGIRIAAIAEVALAKKPAKDEGKKKVNDWVKWSTEMRTAGLALAAAAKKKDPAALKKAADQANTSCTKCHDVFRYE